jgi:hypothetical protein
MFRTGENRGAFDAKQRDANKNPATFYPVAFSTAGLAP